MITLGDVDLSAEVLEPPTKSPSPDHLPTLRFADWIDGTILTKYLLKLDLDPLFEDEIVQRLIWGQLVRGRSFITRERLSQPQLMCDWSAARVALHSLLRRGCRAACVHRLHMLAAALLPRLVPREQPASLRLLGLDLQRLIDPSSVSSRDGGSSAVLCDVQRHQSAHLAGARSDCKWRQLRTTASSTILLRWHSMV